LKDKGVIVVVEPLSSTESGSIKLAELRAKEPPSLPAEMIWIGTRTKSAADTDKKARDMLLSIVKRDSVQSRLRDKVTKKVYVWMDIAKEMKENVFCLPESIKESAEKCRKQYNSLKQANLKFKKNSKETRADSKKKPAHFEDVYDIEKDKDSYLPKYVLDSIDDPKSSDEILSEQETESEFSKFDLKTANKKKIEKV
jgi:hypothetical protein